MSPVGPPPIATSSQVRQTPGVCGGAACIRDTRIAVWLLVQLKQLGRAESDLLADYPGLDPADLDAAWSYYREQTAEIEAVIDAQDRDD